MSSEEKTDPSYAKPDKHYLDLGLQMTDVVQVGASPSDKAVTALLGSIAVSMYSINHTLLELAKMLDPGHPGGIVFYPEENDEPSPGGVDDD